MYNVPDEFRVFSMEFQMAVAARRALELRENLKKGEARVGRGMFKRRFMPEWAIELTQKAAYDHGVSLADIAGPGRTKVVVLARHQAIYDIMIVKPALSSTQLGRWFSKDHSAILYAAAKHAYLNDLPPAVGYNAAGKMARMRKNAGK